MRRALALVLLTGLLAPGCATEDALDGVVKDALDGIDGMIGGKNVPAEHIGAIESYHVPGTWQFEPGVDQPLDRTREAIRGLAAADYGDWKEAAVTTRVLASMANDHPAGLVRLEAIDSLTSVGEWTLESTVDNGDWANERDVIRAVKILREALETVTDGRKPTDEGNLVLADALDTLAAFNFEQRAEEPLSNELRRASRQLRTRERTASGVLRVLTGESMHRLQVSPIVRSAMDRALVNVAAATIRLTLSTAALGDDSAAVRTNAARQLGSLRPEHAERVLILALANDLDSGVRREAARSLANFPPRTALPALVEALFDDVPSVRSTAVRSLVAMTGEDFGDDRAAWVRWLESHDASSTEPPAGDGSAESR